MKLPDFIFSMHYQNEYAVFTVCGIKFMVGNGKFYNKFFPRFLRKSFINSFNSIIIFWNIKRNINIEEGYKNLIVDLDEKSQDNVRLSLDLFRIYSKEDAKAFLKRLRKQVLMSRRFNRRFKSRVKSLKDGVYSYNGYKLPIKHFETSVFYHRQSIDELTTLEKIRSKDIIDVGGFIGDSALIFSSYTDKKIYSFEPSKRNFDLMKRTIELNNLNNVIPENFALGDKVSEKLVLSGYSSGIKTLPAVVDTDENTIESTTLDDFVSKNNIQVGLIKVDIEGYEQHFLKGAEQTIKSQKPALLISIYHSIDDYLHIKPLIESWNLGYKFKICKPEENFFLETLLVAEVPE